jgi:hypothetical protein
MLSNTVYTAALPVSLQALLHASQIASSHQTHLVVQLVDQRPGRGDLHLFDIVI